MRSCKQCGTSVSDDAATCPICGSILAAQNASTPSGSNQPDRKKKKALPKILLIVLAVAVVLFLASRCGGESRAEKEEWPKGTLAQMLPSMNHKCDYAYELEDSLSVSLSGDIKKADYEKYVEACKEKGFAVDVTEGSSSYEAYNSDGYELLLSFSDSDGGTMHIGLDVPKANGTLTWPSIGPATLLPNPEKAKGSIAIDTSTQFNAYVGEMTKAEYDAYVSKCVEAGFSVDHRKYDATFSAKNENGDSLWLEYQGFSTMFIQVYAAKSMDSSKDKGAGSAVAPEGKTAADEPKPAATEPTEPTQAAPTSGINTEFKDAMDSYESFMDGYIAFMEKYSESSDVVAMSADYLKWMSEYSTTVAKIDAIDESTLNAEEQAYYAEVMARVSTKLTDAAVTL